MKRNKCKCGSNKTQLIYTTVRDFGFIKCLDCGNKSLTMESRRYIVDQWNIENPIKWED